MTILKTFLKILVVLVVGIFGGILAQIVIFPYLVQHPALQDCQLIRMIKEQPTIINPTEEIVIQENVALTQAIEKTERVVVGIKSSLGANKTDEGTGLIVTSDGLVVTLANILPTGAAGQVIWEGEYVNFQVMKRDVEKNLTLIKLEKTGLPTVGFAVTGQTKIGRRVFLIGTAFSKAGQTKTVNEGIIKFVGGSYIETNIIENKKYQGSPLFDIEGNVLGLNTMEENGQVFVIPAQVIKDFLGF